jgi:hypothetical protein
MPPTRIQIVNQIGLLSLTWKNSVQTGSNSSVISTAASEPDRDSTPGPASTIYSGLAESFEYEFVESQNQWLCFYTQGSYSKLESFARFYLELLAPEQEPVQPENSFLDKHAGFYILDDNIGLIAHDLCLDKNNLSLTAKPGGMAPVWTPLQRGSSLYFDGCTSYLKFDNPSWKSYFPIAISFWFNSDNENDFTFLDHGCQFSYRLQGLPASNSLKLFLGSSIYRTWTPNLNLFDSTWHQILLFIRGPYHGYVDQCTLHVDSIEQTPVFTQVLGSAISPTLFRFGYSEWDDHFRGHLKYLIIQPDSPSHEDIDNHYKFGKWLQSI